MEALEALLLRSGTKIFDPNYRDSQKGPNFWKPPCAFQTGASVVGSLPRLWPRRPAAYLGHVELFGASCRKRALFGCFHKSGVLFVGLLMIKDGVTSWVSL